MSTIYLARHGQTTWNVEGRYQGRRESPLSPLGERQAVALGQYFEHRLAAGLPTPTRLISSPLGRCTETARAAAVRLGLKIEIDERIIEIGHGTWEGRLRDEITASDPARYTAWRNDPAAVQFEGGESLRDMDVRWRDFARTLLDSEEDVLVLSHDAVLRIALLAATDAPLDRFWQIRAENGAFARLTPDRPAWTLVEECFVGHLAEARASISGQAL